jgi:serine/threonine protein kinase
MIGERLGHWFIEADVGKNEMGRLFRARSADEPPLPAALKWLTHPKARGDDFEKHFLAQVELLRKLRHPGIVSVLGGGTHDGSPYYVMEWVAGAEFATLLRRGERSAWPESLAVALQIIPALRHAHRRGVLHRDLKPSNLFRADDGSYKLADFGVTKFFGDALLTSSDDRLGSAAYLAPEVAAGKPHTKRSDFYSLGCLLYTLVVGRPPFTGNTVVELIHKHCFVLPERPGHFVPDLPEEFERYILKLLAKEPAQRPGSGTLLIREAEGIWSALERRGLLAKKPAPPAPPDEDEAHPEEDGADEPRLPELPPRPPVPWQKRWYIIAPLFAACVLTLLWAFYWRGPSADELMTRARPLLESEDPADWERAWNEYLEPLSRKYPEKYAEEVREAKRRVDEQGEMRRAFLTGKAVRYRSQAERFYHEGLRLVQAGEFAAARRVWDNLVRVYGNVETEKRWVALAREATRRLDERGAAPRPAGGDFADAVRPAVEEVRRLRAAGKLREAAAAATALEFLYRDDPDAALLKEMLAPEKE